MLIKGFIRYQKLRNLKIKRKNWKYWVKCWRDQKLIEIWNWKREKKALKFIKTIKIWTNKVKIGLRSLVHYWNWLIKIETVECRKIK